MATHSSILAWRIPMDKGAWRATVHGVSKSQAQLMQLSTCARVKEMETGIETGRVRGTETDRERRLERQSEKNLSDLLIRDTTECCLTSSCSLKNEKSQESLYLISHYYG